MKIKKGDTVKMLAGKDRGKAGKVLRADMNTLKVVVEGLNLVKKNKRPRKQGEKGEIISKPSPVSVSKVALLCPSCKKSSRVGFLLSKEGGRVKKTRVCKKCQANL